MNISLPMTTREALRDLVTDAPWGTVEEIADLFDLELDAIRDEDDPSEPEIGDEDMERIMQGFASALGLDARISLRIERAMLPDMIAMKGATMPECRLRALVAMGINPMALLMMASLIMDFEIEICGGPYDGSRVEATIVERGTLDAPGGQVVPVITTSSLHWEQSLIRIVGHQIPHVMVARQEGQSLDQLVDHPLTRGLGLVVERIEHDRSNLNVTLRDTPWMRVSDATRIVAERQASARRAATA